MGKDLVCHVRAQQWARRMISIGKITSVEQAVRYLREAVADHQLEYYTVRGESPGRWHGLGADALGLSGEVTDTDFAAVLAGTHPRTGADLGRHWQAQVVVAFDVAVSAPKDVSILYALSDERTRQSILRIHGEGVRAAAEYLQDHAGWARQYNAATKRAEPVRARLVMPEFVHRTARPVTDPATAAVTVDPQLHSHITVPNWAQRSDGSWGQLYSEPLYQHAAAAGAIAQAEWRDRLVRELGVSTVVDGKGCFSIIGITEAQRREFSRRSRQIDAVASTFAMHSRSAREVATLDTRESKHCIPASDDLFALWRERAAGVGLDRDRLRQVMYRETEAFQPRRLDVPEPAAILGVHGLTAQVATFTRRDLIRGVASHAPLGMSRGHLEAIADSLLGDADAVVPLVPTRHPGETDAEAVSRWVESGCEVRYTTPEMLFLEQRMLRTAEQRADAGVGIAHEAHVVAASEARPTLTRDQRLMIDTVCRSRAGVVVIEGAAGVGKTFALEVCREAFDQSGVTTVGCAVAGKAAQGLEEGSAIPSWTVTSMLHDLQVDRLPFGGVLVVDEAGMIGDRQLAELMELAARDNAKLVLVGDPHQLQPIDAGAPMRTLGEHIGKVELTENVRQVAAWERAALDMMRNGRAHEAYQEYASREHIHVALSAEQRRARVVDDHRGLSASGVDAVMLAHRRDEVAALNELARARAVEDGRVHGPALTVGEQEYQAGDWVICLANDRRGKISNGTRGVVTMVDAHHGTMILERPDHREVVIDAARYDAIDRGYALTVHKAQGMTADVALVVGSDGASREWAYTAMSRGTLATHYYEVAQQAQRDREGVAHWTVDEPSAEERTVRVWGRSEEKDSALDYPRRYEQLTAERDPASRWLDPDDNSPTPAQRDLLEHLGAPELATDATWVDASVEIDRAMGREPGGRLFSVLTDLGYSDADAHRVIDTRDPQLGLHHRAPEQDLPDESTIGVVRSLPDDGLLEEAQELFDLEHEHEHELSPDLSPW